jgi:saccharopine dehydrogenase (NAD+, L-lysine-forming)
VKEGHLWVRAETKPNERRTPLAPADAGRLVAAGWKISVESFPSRVFPDQNYRNAGCAVVPSGSWREAPPGAFILGVKELPADDTPIAHTHLYFAHAFKEQTGWRELLDRFTRGGGTLLDLEYLVDEQGRRLAAFGHWAGFAGCALGIKVWCRQRQGIPGGNSHYPAVSSYEYQADLVHEVQGALAALGRAPRVLVIGAKGRSGRGAMACLRRLGMGGDGWDKEETLKGGPFPQILSYDIFVNCVLVEGDVAPFLTSDLLASPRRLSVISDVTCDGARPGNAIPIYQGFTTFQRPVLRLCGEPNPLDLIAIDHLPSLLPRESSEDFSGQLLPCLLGLPDGEVWKRAGEFFRKRVASL